MELVASKIATLSGSLAEEWTGEEREGEEGGEEGGEGGMDGVDDDSGSSNQVKRSSNASLAILSRTDVFEDEKKSELDGQEVERR